MFQSVLLLSGVVVNILLVSFILQSKRKQPHLWYELHALVSFVWAIFLTILLVLVNRESTVYPVFNDFLIRTSYSLLVTYVGLSFFFLQEFPYRKRFPIFSNLVAVGVYLITLGMIFRSTIFIRGVNVFADGRIEVVFGEWMILFAVMLLAYIIWFAGSMFAKISEDKRQSKVMEYSKVLLAHLVSVLGAMFMAIILPYYGWGNTLFTLAPMWSMVIFLHGIIEVNTYEDFDWKIIVSEIMLAMMGIMLIVFIITNDSWYGFFSDFIILIAFLVLSSLLVQDYLELTKSKKILKTNNKNLKEIVLTKDNFLRMTSHQLRTPLTGLYGFVRMILDNEDQDLSYSEEFRREMIKVLLNTQRLNAVVDNLSTANAISSDRFELPRRIETDMKQFVEHLLTEQEHFFEDNDTRVGVEAYGKDWVAPVDPISMREAVGNVLSNAVLLGGGDVRVVFTENQKLFEIDVYDNGIGLTDEEFGFLGKRFRRGSRAIQKHPDGLGLGIYITKVILEKHGGDIHFFSDGVGKGTYVHMVIPKSL